MYRLLAFTVENYRSFCETQTIKMNNADKRSVTAIYGPNAGGKSNIARAITLMISFIHNSSDAKWVAPYEPFLLREETASKPTSFSIEFLADGKRYSYGFSYDRIGIVEEFLLEESAKCNKMNVVFVRKNGVLNPSARQKGFGKRLVERTRDETLLITKGREDNNEYSNIVFDFISHITVVSPSPDSQSPYFVKMLKNDSKLREKTLDLLKDCDFSIRDIKITDSPFPEELFDAMPFQLTSESKASLMEHGAMTFTTVHAIRDEDRTIIGYRDFDFWSQESMGTQRFFEVAVPIIDAIENGKTIFIDEFGTYIHPTLASAIISLFQSEKGRKASLVLTTHNTTLLKGLHREEVVLVEKNHVEESLIKSLTSLGVRDGEAFEKRYLAGLYGGIPIIEE